MNANRPASSRSGGFSLIELLTVLSVAMVLMLIGFPALQHMIQRSKLLGAAEQTAQILRLARLEAIKRNVTTVVEADSTKRTITAFADVNDGAGNPGSDKIFDPPAGAFPPRTVDYRISRFDLPNMVFLWCAPGADPAASPGVFGFTPPPAGQATAIAVFRPDGSAQDTGSFCFGAGPIPPTPSYPGDFLTADVATAATGRITVRKYNAAIAPAAAVDHYWERGTDPSTGQPLWEWHN